jgi:hypothetical protein
MDESLPLPVSIARVDRESFAIFGSRHLALFRRQLAEHP